MKLSFNSNPVSSIQSGIYFYQLKAGIIYSNKKDGIFKIKGKILCELLQLSVYSLLFY